MTIPQYYLGCFRASSHTAVRLLSGQFPYSSQVAFGPVPIQQSGCFRASSHTAVRLLSGQFPYNSQVAFGPVPIQQSGRFRASSHTTVSFLAVRLLSGQFRCNNQAAFWGPMPQFRASNKHRTLTVSSNGYFVLRRIRHRHSFS